MVDKMKLIVGSLAQKFGKKVDSIDLINPQPISLKKMRDSDMFKSF